MSFYGAIWSLLPGPRPVKAILALALIAGVIAVLFTWVFPMIEPMMPFNDITVEPEADRRRDRRPVHLGVPHDRTDDALQRHHRGAGGLTPGASAPAGSCCRAVSRGRVGVGLGLRIGVVG